MVRAEARLMVDFVAEALSMLRVRIRVRVRV